MSDRLAKPSRYASGSELRRPSTSFLACARSSAAASFWTKGGGASVRGLTKSAKHPCVILVVLEDSGQYDSATRFQSGMLDQHCSTQARFHRESGMFRGAFEHLQQPNPRARLDTGRVGEVAVRLSRRVVKVASGPVEPACLVLQFAERFIQER